jgi:predicted phosphodiesterase
MQNKFYYRFIVALLMICPLFTSCAYLSAPGIPLHKGQEQGYFEDLIDCNKPNLPYEKAEDFELRVLDVDKDEALAAPLLLRFVWLTDVHMIQREIKLGSKIFSHALDEVAPSTEFNNAQEDFHWAVYFSQIAAINELHRKDPIDFMIHTGDSANYGSVEEIYQFIYITNKLKIPWLNIVGNHDTTILGNFLSRLGYGRDPNVIFYPVSDLGGFVWMHRSKDLSQISGYGRHLLPVPVNCQHEPSISTWPNKKLVRTFHHGFDLELGETCSTEPSENISYDSKKLGDYATDLCGIPIPVRLIALNSAKKDAFGANISINNEQREKLKKELLHESGGINLVFVHHRLDENNETEALLANHGDGTVVAFTGHKHV